MGRPSQRLRIGVMGAGAIGCYFGGRLVASGGVDVTFVGRPALGEVLAERGMTIREFDRDEHIEASQIEFATEPEALRDCDVVLCCVKSGGTADTAITLSQVLRPETIVVSLQNGIRNPTTLREHLPNNRVVAAIVTFNVVMLDGGLFHHTTSGPLVLETRDMPEHQGWVDAFRAADVEIQEEDPIAPEQWTKLLVNLSNAINALAGVPTRAMILSRDYRRVVAMVLEEALDVLEAAGVRLAKFRGVPLRAMAWIMKLPTPLFRVVIRAQLRIDPDSRSSMWQDLVRGRMTEIDYLNGEIVRLAEEHGIDAPLNRRIVALIRKAERAGTGSPDLSPEALTAALHSASSLTDATA
ncbi:MAG: 2-dehydropantoate 2-reductase [Myxococcota bacterium]